MTTAVSTAIDTVEMTVADVAAAFARGVTAEALTQTFLDRIARYNPRYVAVITPNPDALREAREIDRRRTAGEAPGPLAGVPVVVKDTMDMAGLPSTGGWRLLSARAGGVDLIPATDSPVVARMRAAGAVILGKTNVPVLSASGSHADDSWAGATLNAADPGRVPGGSSAGTATAVAGSLAVLGLAEETGGSIQNPAAAQDLVGIKPSFGLVPNAGVMPLAGSTRDVVGPIARCVRDAALTLDVLAGFSPEDPKTAAGIGHRPPAGYAAGLDPGSLRGRRFGLYGPGWRSQPLSAEVAATYRRAIGELEARGAVLVEDPFAGTGFADIARPGPAADGYDPRGSEGLPHDLDQYLKRLGPQAAIRSFDAFKAAVAAEDPFGPDGVLFDLADLPGFRASLADPLAPPDLSGFLAAKEAYLAIFAETLARHRLDGLVLPQMREVLPLVGSGARIQETAVSEINIAGLPGVTVPAGRTASGAPFGLLFIGPMWSEAALLSFAFDYERATRLRRPPALTP
ncbi:amidase [Inquilinus sp. Marseille-Q2685]|uniref:amidase n=1 Tax=Inquilinus sp. Marseille-Q2685 TaxID=2866581 RepID=UPI001CE493D9|nr:amidase [Inquilinus sp. Marseille-Q2685]